MKDQSDEPPDLSSEPHEHAGFDTERGVQARDTPGAEPGSAGAPENRPTTAESPQEAIDPPPHNMQSAVGPPEGLYPESSEPPTNTTHTARRIPKWAIGVLAIGVAAGVLVIGISNGHDTTSTATSAQSIATTVRPATTTTRAPYSEGADLGNGYAGAQAPNSLDQALIQEFTTQYPGVISYLPKIGRIACGLIPTYLPMYPGFQALTQVIYAIQSDSSTVFGSNMLNVNEASFLLGGAIGAYCPQYTSLEHS